MLLHTYPVFTAHARPPYLVLVLVLVLVPTCIKSTYPTLPSLPRSLGPRPSVRPFILPYMSFRFPRLPDSQIPRLQTPRLPDSQTQISQARLTDPNQARPTNPNKPDQTKPNQTNPNQSKPIPTNPNQSQPKRSHRLEHLLSTVPSYPQSSPLLTSKLLRPTPVCEIVLRGVMVFLTYALM